MKALFKKIIETLTGQSAQLAFKNANLKPVKYIDIYKGQYNEWEKFELHVLPAVLMQWQINHNNNPNTNQSTATITLHLIYENIYSSSSVFNNDKALLHFDFVRVVNELIENLEAENTGKLQLISEESFNPEAIEHAIVLTYQCAYTGKAQDKTSKWNYTPENTVDVNISGTLKDEI